jgi:DNA-binding NarL/FixJ family response regulator
MATPVAAVNTQPVVRLGLREALAGEGFAVENVADIGEWTTAHEDGLVLVGVRPGPEFDFFVDLMAAAPEAAVIVVVPEVTIEVVTAVLGAGARAVIALDAEPAEVVLTMEAVQADKSLIPVDMACELAKAATRSPTRCHLRNEEVDWLRALSVGRTVPEIARRSSYSEREMFRRLRRLYMKMGAGGRIEALILASRWGLLD